MRSSATRTLATQTGGASDRPRLPLLLRHRASERMVGGKLSSHSLGFVPLFGRPHEDPGPSSAGTSDTDQVTTALAHFSALSVPQRAAELLERA
jgi:hypothetical protein